jgi:redox-sensitive bicupin YhaK (pirin superfamily)
VYLQLTLQPGAEHTQEIPKSENAFAFVIEGQGVLGGARAGREPSSGFRPRRDVVEISNTGTKPLSLLLIADEPIGEPVARYGPFVMNSRDELLLAVKDFQEGSMGVLD